MRKHIVVLTLALLAGIVLLNLDRVREAPVAAVPVANEHEEADYYGEQLYRRQYNASGQLEQSFRTASLQHFPLSAVSHFTQPSIITTSDDGKTWQIDAQTGEAQDKDERLTLRQQVEIRSLNAPTDDQILISTDWLNYDARQQLATTDAPVVIRHPATLTEATGMTLDVTGRSLLLHHQVNTRYVPQATE